MRRSVLLALVAWLACPVGTSAEPSFTSLGALRPNGISADGEVVVGLALDAPSQAARWTAATGIERFAHPSPDCDQSDAVATSSDGGITLGSARCASVLPLLGWLRRRRLGGAHARPR